MRISFLEVKNGGDILTRYTFGERYTFGAHCILLGCSVRVYYVGVYSVWVYSVCGCVMCWCILWWCILYNANSVACIACKFVLFCFELLFYDSSIIENFVVIQKGQKFCNFLFSILKFLNQKTFNLWTGCKICFTQLRLSLQHYEQDPYSVIYGLHFSK